MAKETVLAKLKDAYHRNGGDLFVTITKWNMLDLSGCKEDGDILDLTFTDGTSVKLKMYPLEKVLLGKLDADSCADITIDIKDGAEEYMLVCGKVLN